MRVSVSRGGGEAGLVGHWKLGQSNETHKFLSSDAWTNSIYSGRSTGTSYFSQTGNDIDITTTSGSWTGPGKNFSTSKKGKYRVKATFTVNNGRGRWGYHLYNGATRLDYDAPTDSANWFGAYYAGVGYNYGTDLTTGVRVMDTIIDLSGAPDFDAIHFVIQSESGTASPYIEFDQTTVSIKEITAGDSSGYSNHGSLVNGPTYTMGPTARDLGPERLTNAGSGSQTDWTDSNADGVPDDWNHMVTTGTPSIVTGNGFTGNAARRVSGATASYIGTGSNQIVQSGKTYRLSLKYRCNGTIQSGTGGYSFGNLNKGLVGYWPLKSAYETTGSNRVTNGTFDADSGWTKGTGVTIANGKATYASGAVFPGLQQTNVGTLGKKFAITFTVSDYVSGNPVIIFGDSGTQFSLGVNGNGAYSGEHVWDGTTTTLYLREGFQGSIDNIVVKEIVTADTTANDNHGSVYGATVGSEYTTFDGVNDYVDIGNDSTLALENYTVSSWFKWESDHPTDIYRTILSKNKDSVGYKQNYMLCIYDSDHLLHGRIGKEGGTTEMELISTTDVADGLWHLGTLTYNSIGGDVKLYVDGILEGSSTTNLPAYTDTTAPVTIGLWGGANYGEWDGNLSDVRIYNRAISPLEVKMLYDQGR